MHQHSSLGIVSELMEGSWCWRPYVELGLG